MMEAGKNDPLVQENEQEREADWNEAKDASKDIAMTGAEVLLAKRLGGASFRTAGRLARYGKKLFGAGKNAASNVGKYRQSQKLTALEGELLPRAGSRAPARLTGPSSQGKLSGPPQKRLTGPNNTPPSSGGAGSRPPPPPPPSGGGASGGGGGSSGGVGKLLAPRGKTTPEGVRHQMRPTNASAKADRDLAAYQRGDITRDEYLKGEYEPFKKGGKVRFGNKVPVMKRSDAGENPAMVKKEMAFMQRKGAPKSMMKHEKKEAKGMKKMAAGGMAAPGYNMSQTPGRGQLLGASNVLKNLPSGGMAAPGYNTGVMKKMAKGGMSCMKRGGGIEVKGYKKGGMIDGCAQRGHTRATKRK
jgi:hypothetical protein